MNKTNIITLLFLVCISQMAFAQDSLKVKPTAWTLEDCINWAKQENVSVKRGRVSVEQQRINIADAHGIDILSQFLIEAIMISVTGGVIGVLLGFGASMAIKTLANWPVSVEAWTVVLAFVVCTITGIFFGWYPAKKAANLDPIEAIRYE